MTWSSRLPPSASLWRCSIRVLIRAGREEQAMMTALAGLIVVLLMMIQEIKVLFDAVKTTFGI